MTERLGKSLDFTPRPSDKELTELLTDLSNALQKSSDDFEESREGNRRFLQWGAYKVDPVSYDGLLRKARETVEKLLKPQFSESPFTDTSSQLNDRQ